MFAVSYTKPIKINDASASYKSAAWKSFGFGIDESMGVVKRDETVCRFNKEIAAHITKTELDIYPTHLHNVLFTVRMTSYICERV